MEPLEPDRILELRSALGERLALTRTSAELVVIGGSALGLGRHEEDLRALSPTPDELRAAARWTITQDPSEGFRQELLGALCYLGVEDVGFGD